MFYISKDKKRIVDSSGNIVGFLDKRRFLQSQTTRSGVVNTCHPNYSMAKGGLSAIEMEQISEIMQSNGYS